VRAFLINRADCPVGRASTKAAGVVVDDTAVTPRYVHDFTADRELPMIKRIAVGSLRQLSALMSLEPQARFRMRTVCTPVESHI
jgi:predicted DNA repair protein MutK